MRQDHQSIAITDRSSVGEVRRAAGAAAEAMGFSEQKRSDISIVATEAATNILLHAQRGEVLICPTATGDVAWLDLLALDGGPGIRNVDRAFEDGVSTIGTAGQGLGAMERLSDAVSLYSSPGQGTVVFCRFRRSEDAPVDGLGVTCIPVSGETRCGDAYLAIPGEYCSLYVVADGLGHGPVAHEAASEAIATVRANAEESLTEILTASHDALKKTRGAAMSLARVDHDRAVVTYAGVGNVSAALVTPGASRSMVCQNGTLGAVMPRLQEYNYPLAPETTLLMFSDGLSSKCGITANSALRNRPPALIAGLLYRDFSRRRDDATVLAATLEGGRS